MWSHHPLPVGHVSFTVFTTIIHVWQSTDFVIDFSVKDSVLEFSRVKTRGWYMMPTLIPAIFVRLPHRDIGRPRQPLLTLAEWSLKSQG
jgi:hypothetical protein